MTKDSDCLFCAIVAGEIPATKVAETESTFAFRDINPQAPTHVLVIPKEHHTSAADVAQFAPQLLGDMVATAGEIARSEGLDGGYRLVFNTGPDAGQTVFHVHLHLLGGRALGWPPG
jgi:histidine triad (HIT) family protein